MGDKPMTLMQKMVLSDIISMQLRGMDYFKISQTLANELGGYSNKTIQSAFQKLAKMEYIETELVPATKKRLTLRYARVLDLEYWVCNEQYLQGRARKGRSELSTSQPETPASEQIHIWVYDEETYSISIKSVSKLEDASVSEVLKINCDQLYQTYPLREALLEKEAEGFPLDYRKAVIDMNDSMEPIEDDDVLVVYDSKTAKCRFMPRSFMENPPMMKVG